MFIKMPKIFLLSHFVYFSSSIWVNPWFGFPGFPDSITRSPLCLWKVLWTICNPFLIIRLWWPETQTGQHKFSEHGCLQEFRGLCGLQTALWPVVEPTQRLPWPAEGCVGSWAVSQWADSSWELCFRWPIPWGNSSDCSWDEWKPLQYNWSS